VIASGVVFFGAGRCSYQAGSLATSVVDMMKEGAGIVVVVVFCKSGE
jgi:hypothetical protein